MPLIAREHPALATFSVTYLAAFTVIGALMGQRAVVYLVTMLVLFFVVARVYRRFELRPAVLWALSVWGLLHMSGGLAAVGDGVLYGVQLVPGVLRFDQLVHAFGFGAATVAVWDVLSTFVGPENRRRVAIAVLAALGGLGIDSLNEVFEFAASRVFEATNVGGYVNTGWDLVFNLLGTSAAAIWLATRTPAITNDARGPR